jgi:hypothetical protein
VWLCEPFDFEPPGGFNQGHADAAAAKSAIDG